MPEAAQKTALKTSAWRRSFRSAIITIVAMGGGTVAQAGYNAIVSGDPADDKAFFAIAATFVGTLGAYLWRRFLDPSKIPSLNDPPPDNAEVKPDGGA